MTSYEDRIDFREDIQDLYDNNTEDELQEKLGERTGEDPEELTSVTPNTDALFKHILPGEDPLEYVTQRRENAAEWTDLRKRGTALLMLLNLQIGRPKYERIGQIRKPDRADFLMAAIAHDEGYELSSDAYMPTTLPIGAEQYWEDPPSRTTLPERHLDTIAPVDERFDSALADWLRENPEVRDADYGVYVLDCTPPTGPDEPESIQMLRRDVQATLEFGADIEGSIKKAGAALNKNCRTYYVGMAADPADRVGAHIAGAHKSVTDMTNLFSPAALCELHPCETDDDAEELEGKRADEINTMESAFAHSDQLSVDALEHL
ncbi:hypothetical protein G3I44_14245 [Halogeometricum borinquense]|uniref:Uncharacterized protein n=1 Tax=Halogeometricum borinquense TaxID=60847 RepID=A0A6C0UIK0_9EURY|nr:hypothetical protein [Halogeometricum borinquense]QIB75346.1 hypothetical protein G3I44_14245 [Halogeometricum borinquense]